MFKSFLQGRFMNHPLHPIFVHFPIGLWVVSFIFDLLFLINPVSTLAAVSYYCMIGGIIGAVLAAITGMAEYLEIPKHTLPKRIATTHLLLNVFVLALFIINALARYNMEGGTPTLVTRGQFFLNLFSVLILGAAGYLGGLLVYDYGIGFKPQLRGREREKPDVRRVA